MSSHPLDLPARLRDRPPFAPHPNPSFGNPDFAGATVRVLILRLSPWRDVASSSPHLFLAQAVRQALPGAFLDFAFLPAAEERKLLQAAHLPLAIGVQSQRGLGAFDLVLISNAFLLETINLPMLLLDAGLSPWADERPEGAPVLLLGGSNALAAHTLVRPDGVAVPDAFFFGEGEEGVVPFLQVWQANAGLPRRARLLAAAVEGLWVTGAWPEGKATIRQAVTCRPAAPTGPCPTPPPCDPLLDGEAADTVRLPAAFGCPAFCSFCLEGFERKPYREIPADVLLARARERKRASGARCAELDAYTLNSHAEAGRLLLELSRLYERVTCKSQRVDILADQPALVALELAAGKRSFTLGIEGVSPRLRAFLNKNITDEEIGRVVQNLLVRGVREIKLFYLITGHERAEDLATFGAFTRELGLQMHAARRTTRLVFSFGFLVRMPQTPLRHDRLFLEREPLERIMRELERMCTRSHFEFRLAASWSEYFVSQLLAAGDYRLATVLVALAREGVVYDGTTTADYAQRLQALMCSAGLWTDELLAEKPARHRFPFAFVARPVTDKFLWKQYEAAREARETGYCLGDTCLTCGACPTAAARKALTQRVRRPEIAGSAPAELDALVRAKQRLAPLHLRVRLGEEFDRASATWSSARLQQLLLAELPDEVENLLSVEEALFTGPEYRERFPMPAGETVLALKAWDARRLAARLQAWCAQRAAPGAAELEVLELLPSFTPGSYRSAAWQVTTPAPLAPLEAAVAGWLQECHLAYTLRRLEHGARFELAPAALRKGVVLAATCQRTGDESRLEITLGFKAEWLAFLRRLPAALERPVQARCRELRGAATDGD
jgi:hypothetical protein